jgi:hypothetical protein
MEPTEVLIRTLRPSATGSEALLRAAWRDVPPNDIGRLIRSERCGMWLYRRLHDLHLEDAPRDPLVPTLAREARVVAAKNLLVETEAHSVSLWLRAHGHQHVFLKGVARRAVSDLPYGDARATHDVDVLVEPVGAEQIWRQLQASGYAPVYPDLPIDPGSHHLPPLWTQSRVAVEIHRSIGRDSPAAEAWRRTYSTAREVEWNGLKLIVPSATELLWQSIIHAARDGVHAWRLRYFQDAAVVIAADGRIDWAEIQRRLTAAEAGDPERARRWLESAAWLAEKKLPGNDALAEVSLPRLLRWRYLVLERFSDHPRMMDKLLDEATRAEARFPLTPTVTGSSPVKKVRRRAAALGARLAYVAWQLQDRGEPTRQT